MAEIEVVLIEKYNKRHAPKGTKHGGQFISGHTALAMGQDPQDYKPKGPYIKPYTALFSQAVARLYGPKQPIDINVKPGAEGYYAEYGINTYEILTAMGEVSREVRADQLQGITKIELVNIQEAQVAGSYTYGSGVLQIDPAESTLNKYYPKSTSLQHSFKHEIGHNAWQNLSGDQRVAFATMVGYPYPEDVRDVDWYAKSTLTPEQVIMYDRISKTKVRSATKYGESSILESWAEYFSYINWQSHKLMWNTQGMSQENLNVLEGIRGW